MNRPISDLFDGLASEYIDVRRDVGWSPWPHIEAWLGKKELQGWAILDVGCGTGEVAKVLVDRGARVVGVDASEKMCELAAAAVPTTFMQVDLGEGLPFESESFDASLALGCVEYVEDVEAACRELVRVVRPGGLVLYCVELCEEGLCGGTARTFELYEEWTRYRRTFEEVCATASALLEEVSVDRVPAYVFDDTSEKVGYARVMGRVPSGG